LRVAQLAAERGEAPDGAVERFLFLTEVLRALRVGPDARVLEQACDFV
jgi:hypothetical protein